MSQSMSQENMSQEMSFDQAGIELLAAAFEKAWAFIKADPVLIEAGLTVTPTDLAAALMTAVEQDSNPQGSPTARSTRCASASRSAAR